MIDLHDLEGRVASGTTITLSQQEGAEIVTELTASRAILGLLDGPDPRDIKAQRDMVAQLLANLSRGAGSKHDIDLVATVVVIELFALARCQVRAEVRT